jgi:DNA polymerase-1
MGNLSRRMLYGMKPLSHEGRYTQAIKGSLSKIQELEQKLKPTHVALCFDSKGKNWRHDLYPDYKANRKAARDEKKPPAVSEKSFNWQSRKLRHLMKALGYPILRQEGQEADDYVGSVVTQFMKRYPKGRVFIYSGDKDFSSLVTERVHHLYPIPWQKNGGPAYLTLDPKGVREKFGVKPSQMQDYLSMMGDSVDNVPGIYGIGYKGATALLVKWGSLDRIQRHLKDLAPGHRKAFEKCKKLDLWRQVIALKLDLKLSISSLKLTQRAPDRKLVKSMYQELGFRAELKAW